MPETKSKMLRTLALASLTTGTLMDEFGRLHEAAEWLAGHPIWTHHFAQTDLCDRLCRLVLEQFPEMPTECPDGWEAARDAVLARYGAEVSVRKGSGEGAQSPLDGLPEGKRVVVVAPGGGNA